MKVFLIGGGSGGAISPVFAVAEAVAKLEINTVFYLIGAKESLDQKFLDNTVLKINYLTIPAGKWRRYFSIRNFFDFFKVFFGFLKSLYLIKKHKPDIIFGAGSFVQVPMSWAGFFSRVPTIIHQQDFDLLLSTRLTAPVAKIVTTSFDASLKELPAFSGLFKKIKKSKFFWTGNPVRREVLDGSRQKAIEIFGLDQNYPTVLIIGGSTGSEKLNTEVISALPELVKYVQVIHLTGGRLKENAGFEHEHYHSYDFLSSDLKHAYAVSDMVVCRAGMSTITELSYLEKVAVVVPLPQSAQEDNAKLLGYLNCAVVIFEEFLTPEMLMKMVRKILWDRNAIGALKNNIKMLIPKNADQRIAKLILKAHDEFKKNK